MTPESSSSPAGAAVPTYRGQVGGADLGWTLTHEHLFVLAPELDGDYPHPEWDAEQAVDTAVRGLDELYRLGVRTVVDLVAATGWSTDDVLPPYFRTHGPGLLVGGPDPLVEMFRQDVTEGIGGSGVRAGVLKVVTGAAGLTPDVTRVTPPSWRREHTPSWTHDHLSRRIVPRLLAGGADPRDIESTMVENPRRFLTGAP